MIRPGKISVMQLIMLIFCNRLLFSYYLPTATIAPGNQDAWIADILSGFVIFLFGIPMLIMAKSFKKLSFDEYFQLILGKFLGKCICFLYAIYLMYTTLFTIVFLTDFLLSAVLPDTPMFAILAVMLIPCIYATYKGLETIGRASIIFGAIFVVVVLLCMILNSNNMDLKELLPILADSTASELAFGVFFSASKFSDCFLFFLFVPYIKNDKQLSITKIFAILIVCFVTINTLITIDTQAVLGVGLTRILKYPYNVSIQQISLFDIIQRIEIFNVTGWIIIFFMKIASSLLAGTIILGRIFNMKTNKPLIIPNTIILGMIVLMTSVSHYIVFKTLIEEYTYLIIFTANLVVPLMILMVFAIRRKKLMAIYEQKYGQSV